MTHEPLFDVCIIEWTTNKIASIIGKSMRRDTGHYNAEKRAETAMMRCNENYGPAIVPAGKYKVGQIVKKGDVK